MRIIILLTALCLFLTACTGKGGGKMDGTVTLPDGAPAAGADVRAYDVPEKSDVPPVASTVADGQGRFSFALKPGTYYLAARLNAPGGGPPMLSKIPPDAVAVGKGAAAVELRLSGGGPAVDCGVAGRAVSGGKPLAGATVYLYENTDSGLKGPSYAASGSAGADGGFRVAAKPGRYYVTVRKRGNNRSAGELSSGDLSGEFSSNPIEVRRGAYSDAGGIVLSPVDDTKLAVLKIGISGEKAAASITGSVSGEDGSPLRGVYVFAYTDFKMMGKPRLISERTGPDGRYTLSVDKPGKYYVGARDSIGGPMEPGDLVGVYEGTADNSVSCAKGARLSGVDLVLKEVQ